MEISNLKRNLSILECGVGRERARSLAAGEAVPAGEVERFADQDACESVYVAVNGLIGFWRSVSL